MNVTPNATISLNSSSSLFIFQWTLIACLITLTEAGNMLTLVSVVKYRSLRKECFLFIPSLAAADALAGIAIAVHSVTFFRDIWCTSVMHSTLTTMAVAFPLLVSHLHILIIAVDRFIAIAFPFRYEVLVTEKRLRQAIVGVWIWALFQSLTFLSWGWEERFGKEGGCSRHRIPLWYINWGMAPVFVLIIVTLVVTYATIFRVAKRKIAAVTPVATVESTTSGNGQYGATGHQGDNGKASKHIAAVIGAYFVTWVMFFGLRVSLLIRPNLSDLREWGIFEMLALDIGFCNSALNVFIYTGFLSEFRKAYGKLVCCCLRKNWNYGLHPCPSTIEC